MGLTWPFIIDNDTPTLKGATGQALGALKSVFRCYLIMGVFKKILYFPILNRVIVAFGAILLCLVAVVLIPTHPYRGASGHRAQLIEHPTAKWNHELFRIYSIVKSRTMDLKDASTWDISEAILREGKKNSLDPLLLLAVIDVESSFQHTAVSNMGARGLMQIRPIVAHAMADKVDLDVYYESRELNLDALDDPILNIKLGAFYLQYLKNRFSDLELALTAYNWGPTEIDNRLTMEEAVPLEYALKVLTTYQKYRRLERQMLKRP